MAAFGGRPGEDWTEAWKVLGSPERRGKAPRKVANALEILNVVSLGPQIPLDFAERVHRNFQKFDTDGK